LIIYTNITSARILVLFELTGVALAAFGIWDPLASFAKSGITVPIIGFGASLAKGVIGAVKAKGLIGAFTGGVTASAGGIAAAVFFGYIASLISKPKMKKE